MIFILRIYGITKKYSVIALAAVLFFTWSGVGAEAAQKEKAYTIMIYMNGSDLESENGAATNDIVEILNSGVDTSVANVLIFTGGTHRWHNRVVPSNNCVIWKVTNGALEKVTGMGLINMGDPDTLTSFIDFSVKNYPATKYGLILWDHGGGSIAGYGHDEKFNYSNLTLSDMGQAFENSILNKKLEFLGFDSCLMATVEMGVTASDYAHYLVASEDLEPGEGWDYSFLSVINNNPGINGRELGIEIVDRFMDFYGPTSDEILTLSVIDLSNVTQVMDEIGNLMSLCTEPLSYAGFAKRRSGTKTFGIGSPRDNECDMVDIGDMAAKHTDLHPEEASAILAALKKAVVYNRHNSSIDLKGLSVYYIYGGKYASDESLPIYTELNLNNTYTNYLYSFADILKNKSASASPVVEELADIELTMWEHIGGRRNMYRLLGIQKAVDVETDGSLFINGDVKWPMINGKYVCLYETSVMDGHSLYAIPATLNGKECDIIVMFSESYPNGKILGGRLEDGFIIQKGYEEIKTGDKIAFYYQEMSFSGNTQEAVIWHKSDEFTVNGGLNLNWGMNAEGLFSLYLVDVWGNEYFTGLGY